MFRANPKVLGHFLCPNNFGLLGRKGGVDQIQKFWGTFPPTFWWNMTKKCPKSFGKKIAYGKVPQKFQNSWGATYSHTIRLDWSSSTPLSDRLNVLHSHDFRWKEFTQKKSIHFAKIEIANIAVISKLDTNLHNCNKIHYKYLANILLQLKNYFCHSFLWTFAQKERKNAPPKRIYDKTPCVWSNKLTQAKKVLHNRWLWWLRHLEGHPLTLGPKTTNGPATYNTQKIEIQVPPCAPWSWKEVFDISKPPPLT